MQMKKPFEPKKETEQKKQKNTFFANTDVSKIEK